MGLQQKQKQSAKGNKQKLKHGKLNKIKRLENQNQFVIVKKNQKGEQQVVTKKSEMAIESANTEQQAMKKEKKIMTQKRKKILEAEQEEPEHFDKEGFFIIPDSLKISDEDEKILKMFQQSNIQDKLASMLNQNIQEKIEEKKQIEYKQNLLLNPKVQLVYSDIAKLLKTYKSGKLAKAFKVIPTLEQWEDILKLTKPEEWSSQAMLAATRLMASNLDNYRAKIFYEHYLLPTVKNDIMQHKKLNFHYYYAIKRALYKPAAWFKGIIFPICLSSDCTLKVAQIVGSILSKMSIPSVHSSVALLKLCELDYNGPIGIFMKALIEKKYALPNRVINQLVNFFCKFEQDKRQFPVLWHQLILSFCQLYGSSLEDIQKEGIKKLVAKKTHYQISPEILKCLNNPNANSIDNGTMNIE